MRQFVLLVLVGCAATAAATEPPERIVRKAWELQDEERLAKRLDSGARAERLLAHARRQRELTGKPAPEGATWFDSIDGAAEPELFLPWELFDSLAGEAADAVQGKRTMTTAADLRAAGFDETTFWRDLHSIAAEFLARKRRLREVHQEGLRRARTASGLELRALEAEWFDQRAAECRERLAALDAARAHFGAAAFDRFLYAVVAPKGSIAYGSVYHDELRWASGKCR
jgi:hypothetical protein